MDPGISLNLSEVREGKVKDGPLFSARGRQKADSGLVAELKEEDTGALSGGNRKIGRRRTGKGCPEEGLGRGLIKAAGNPR